MPGSRNGESETGEGILLGMKFNGSGGASSSFKGFGETVGFGGCLGDSKIEHNFLTFPFNEFPAETIDPNGELYKLLIEPARWKTGVLYRLYRGLSSVSGNGDDELKVTDRLKYADKLLFCVSIGLSVPWFLQSAIKIKQSEELEPTNCGNQKADGWWEGAVFRLKMEAWV